MDQRSYISEAPPENINFLETADTCEHGYNTFCNSSDGKDAPFSLCVNKNTVCLPRNIREHLIMEYTAIFVNMEGDVAEFYLKMSNELLKQFPFLHVDHPLHEYYEFIKKYPQKRVFNKFPHMIPMPLRIMFEYATEIEKKKKWKSETTEKVLKEKQMINLIEKKKKMEEEQQDQSYSTLFQRYMQSDEETEETECAIQNKDEKEKEVHEITIQEINNFIEKINDLNNNSVNSYLYLLMKHIEKYKFLQFGSVEYNYFKSKIPKAELSAGDCDVAQVADFLTFLLKISEHGMHSEKQGEHQKHVHKEEEIEDEDNLKTIQNFRREKAKMLLHGLQKK